MESVGHEKLRVGESNGGRGPVPRGEAVWSLRALPVEQARAVLLAGCYGLTAREIAEREQVPLGTAKTRIRRGLIRLRDDFGVSDD